MSERNGSVKSAGGEYEGGMVLIPAAIMQLDLPPQAKLIFGAIWAVVQMKAHRCWMANWRIAETVGTSVNSRFKFNLQLLERAGLIRRVWDAKNHREEIRVTWFPGTVIEIEPDRRRARHPSTTSGPPQSTTSGPPQSTTSGPKILSEKQTEKKTACPPAFLPAAPGPSRTREPPPRLHDRTPEQHRAEQERQKEALRRRMAERDGKDSAP